MPFGCLKRLANKKLELARLVPAQCKASLIVPLDRQLWTTESRESDFSFSIGVGS